MAKQFTPDEDEQVSQKKSSQQRLLLLLLLLIGLFAYLYFFTGLIKPREEAAVPPPPQPAPAVVKKPLPPRPQGTDTSASAKPAETKPAEGQAKPAPAAAQAPAGKPAAVKETKPAAVKEAKPAAAKETKPAAAKEAKSVTKEAKEAKSVAKAKTKPAAKAKPAAGAFALELDSEIAESEVSSVIGKLKKAGIGNVVTTKSHKGEPMHRLFLADFGSRDEAAEELGRLKGAAPNAFMLKENGRYAVYAGSFMREGKAAVEQDRLYDKGVRLLLRKANIPVTVVKVRAGSFADPTSAEKAAANLKKTGLSAKVVKAGK